MTNQESSPEETNISPENEENKLQSPIYLLELEQQISLRKEGEKVIVTLPTLTPEQEDHKSPSWEKLLEDFKTRLQAREKRWDLETKVDLLTQDRLLDTRQLQTLAHLLREFNLDLSLVITSRRQTAVAAASAGYSVQQNTIDSSPLNLTPSPTQQLAEPLYLKTTIRSGVEIRHLGSVIILGDVNPGGSIIAGGDVFVWGTLRGIAHGGATGNRECLIMALKMEPTQLRIADLVARAPEPPSVDFYAEVAYISKQGIKISSALNFGKTNFFSEKIRSWIDVQSS
jgi:septum site-determining protein MinC